MQLLPLLRSMFRLANVIFALASSLAVATQASIEVEITGLPGVFWTKNHWAQQLFPIFIEMPFNTFEIVQSNLFSFPKTSVCSEGHEKCFDYALSCFLAPSELRVLGPGEAGGPTP